MADLTFMSNYQPQHSSPIHIRTEDVLAIVNLGAIELADKAGFAHRRGVYIKDGVDDKGHTKVSIKTVWERSSNEKFAVNIRHLDAMDGKQKVNFAKVAFHGTSNSSVLNSANNVSISIEPEDLKVIKNIDSHHTMISRDTSFRETFTVSGQGIKISEPKPLYYAHLQLGVDTEDVKAPRLAIAHLDKNRFSELPALTKG